MSEQLDKIRAWVGDEAAAILVDKIFGVSQLADDLVDGDKPMDKSAAMVQLLTLAIVDIPANPFYRQYQGWLAPLMVNVLTAWGASNTWHKSTIADLQMMGWAWRDMGETLISGIAYLTQGAERALIVAQEVGEYYRTNNDAESLEQWSKSL